MVVCRLKRNAEFRLNDGQIRASSSQRQEPNSHESRCNISETGMEMDAVEQDKGVGCSTSKRSNSSYGSPSLMEQTDSSESNQRLITYAESSGHQKVDFALRQGKFLYIPSI